MSAAPPPLPKASTAEEVVSSQPQIALSIVVPTYNYATRLESCLDTVLPQLTPATELVVIDDGSTDGTDEILRRRAASGFGNLRSFRQANQGAAAARNHGLKQCSGRYVLFLDADDELMPGTVHAVAAYLQEHPEIDMLVGGHASRRPDGKERTTLPGGFPDGACARVAAYLIDKKVDLGHGSFVARRELLARCPYPQSLRKREDIPVFAYLLARARIAAIDHVMVRVNKHPTSLRHLELGGEDNTGQFVAEVFKLLPDECAPLRRRYAAIRYQAAFRNALAKKCWSEAAAFLRQSWQNDWRQACRWTSVRKALRALLQGRAR